MTTIGIDPGDTHSAMTVYDGDEIVYCGKLENKFFFERLKIEHGVASESAPHPVRVFMEGIQSYGMPVGQSVFDTCIYIGRLQLLLEQNSMSYEMVKRTDIKLHHCGQTRAKDSNVRAALIERFGDKGTKKAPGFFYGIAGNDQWSACAIAIYGYDKLNGRL